MKITLKQKLSMLKNILQEQLINYYTKEKNKENKLLRDKLASTYVQYSILEYNYHELIKAIYNLSQQGPTDKYSLNVPLIWNVKKGYQFELYQAIKKYEKLLEYKRLKNDKPTL